MKRPARQEKILARKKLRLILRSLEPAQRRAGSARITAKILSHSWYAKSKSILCYVSFGFEADTRALIKKALKDKKRVFVPRLAGGCKVEIYRVLDPAKDLKKNELGIPEPRPVKARRGRPGSLDLIIVPGLGFDRKGGRLGRGLGCFDRFLEKTAKARKIGIAFRKQLLKKTPVEKHDVRMDLVITD